MKNRNNGKVAELKDRLREALDDSKMRPIDLSEKTGIPKSMISYYLSGKSQPKADRIYEISRVLDINEAWLMGYDVEKNRTPGQKKNDQVVKLVAQLRNNAGFYDLVCDLAELPAEQYDSIKQLVSALRSK